MRSWGEFSPKSCPAQFRAGSGGSPVLTWAVGSLVISIDVGCCGSRSSRTAPILPQEALRSPERLAPTHLSKWSGAASKPETGPWSRDAA